MKTRGKKRVCRDCKAEGLNTRRAAPHPGPRCTTHHKVKLKAQKTAKRAAHILRTYGITLEEYDAIYRHQGGRCYICQRATGARRALAVDHDHKTGYVRGLLCKPCNRGVLGHLRDNPESLARATQYLQHPPAFDILGKRKVPDTS